MFWNKIEVDSKIILKDNNPLFLEINKPIKLDIKVLDNVSSKLVILGNNDYEINVVLNSNTSLNVNSLNKDNNPVVNICLKENSMVNYNHSVLSKENSQSTFNINHIENNSSSNINNNGINMNDGKLFFTINGVIPKKLSNINCNQNSMIINFKKGNSKIIPNLIIDSNDIIANHSAYIGEIGEEELFYLKSRGISKENIEKLIYKAILLGKMDMSMEKEEFNKIINEWW